MKIMDQTAVTGEINLFFLLLLLLPLLLLILKHIRLPSLKDPSLPPGPFSWPIIGNILQMGKKPHLSLAYFAQIHGPLISLRLGTQLLVVGSSPVAATEILKTHDRLFSARYVPHVAHIKSPDLNHLSLFWSFECTDKWKFLRTICRTELFSAKAIESQLNLRERKVNEMVGFVGTKEGKVVKIGELVFTTIFNILSNLFFSEDFIDFEDEGLAGGMKGTFRRMMELGSTPNLADFYPILGGLDLQGLTKISLVCMGKVCGLWEVLIKERRESNCHDVSRQLDFLDVLLSNGFMDDQINQLILTISKYKSKPETIEQTYAALIKNIRKEVLHEKESI
ncbi:hypothetical protein HHK36_028866 [Tetracentron sinense]|uniref:Cytochrome P450 n=1 Tax=Tetracentron sinense TaxID=13715 RepID=A0A834YC73_TETSI|nr:hypothetical protein HHK36_028866 [Tetracentron sinense]